MPPRKRKLTEKASAAKKSKTEDDVDIKEKIDELVKNKKSYCDELGIDIKDGGSDAAFQWLCCSLIFGNRISEKTTIRAAKGLLNCGLTDPKSVKEASFEEKVKALNSEGSVQRGPSMSSRLSETAALVLDKYDGDLNKLRDAANKDLAKEKKLLKEFKGIGEMGLNIFLREAQLAWEEAFPYADKRTLDMAKQRGLPAKSAKDLAEHVGSDREKFVRLLGAVVKAELRGEDEADEDRAEKPKEATDGKAQAQPEAAGGEDKDSADKEKEAETEKKAEVDAKKGETKEGEGKEVEEKAEAKGAEGGDEKGGDTEAKGDEPNSEEEKAGERTAEATVDKS